MGVRTYFVQEESLGIKYVTRILATSVVEDVPKYQEILILKFGVTSEHRQFLLVCLRGYWVGCLSCAIWLPCNGIHCFSGRHL